MPHDGGPEPAAPEEAALDHRAAYAAVHRQPTRPADPAPAPPSTELSLELRRLAAVQRSSGQTNLDAEGAVAALQALDGTKAGRFTVLVNNSFVDPGVDGCRTAPKADLAEPHVAVIAMDDEPGCVAAQVPTYVAAGKQAPLLVDGNDPAALGQASKAGAGVLASVVTPLGQEVRSLVRYAAKTLQARRCGIVSDGSAEAAQASQAAPDAGVVAASVVWSSNEPETAITTLKGARVDCVVLVGTRVAGLDRVLAEKVKLLGDNEKVPVLAASTLGAWPNRDAVEKLAIGPGRGMLLSRPDWGDAPVLDGPAASTEVRKRFAVEYAKAYVATNNPGRAPSGRAVAVATALQLVRAAIAASDGTPSGVRTAVFSSPGVAVRAEQSLLPTPVALDPASGAPLRPTLVLQRVGTGTETVVSA